MATEVRINSIVFTRFVTPMEGASRLAVALHRLGTWFDAEVGDLEDLLDTAGHEDGIDDLDALHALHLEADAGPDEIRRLLERGSASLEDLLARLRYTPGRVRPTRFSTLGSAGRRRGSRRPASRSAARSRPEVGRAPAPTA